MKHGRVQHIVWGFKYLTCVNRGRSWMIAAAKKFAKLESDLKFTLRVGNLKLTLGALF